MKISLKCSFVFYNLLKNKILKISQNKTLENAVLSKRLNYA